MQLVAPMYKPEGYDASRDAFKGDNQAKEPRVLPKAPVYKPVEYDSSRDEILEDPNKVKEPRALPESPMYKPEGYDASRDAFKIIRRRNHGRYMQLAEREQTGVTWLIINHVDGRSGRRVGEDHCCNLPCGGAQ